MDTKRLAQITKSEPAECSMLECYQEVRSHIEHEDTLYNNRMSWLISLQSFLFGAYGLTVASEKVDPEAANKAHVAFSLIGIASAVAILVALLAARYSTRKVVQYWYNDSPFPDELIALLPPIIGTHPQSRQNGTFLGVLPLYAIPVSCSVVWFFIIQGPVLATFVLFTEILSLYVAHVFGI